MLSRKWYSSPALAVLGLASAILMGCKPKAAGPPPGGPPDVAFVTLSPEPLVLSTELPGRTAAYLTAEIRPQVNGIVQSRQFEEGAYVRAGDILYRIDPTPYETVLNQAKAGLATAEADLSTAEANLPSLQARVDRYKDLVAIHAVGQQDYDDAAAALAQARAIVKARQAAIETSRAAQESARINLSYTPIKAPITGRIGKSNVTVGSLATAYQPAALAVVQQIDPIYVDVVQANADLLRLRRSIETGELQADGSHRRRVRLVLEDGSSYPIVGTLQFRDVNVDSSTGAVSLRLVFANPKGMLLPGMYVRAVVEDGVRKNAILAPQQGVKRDLKGNPYAWVVGGDGKVRNRPLQLDRAIVDRWLVMSGLSAGDRLVLEGCESCREGQTVHAVPFAASSNPIPNSQPAAPKAQGQPKARGNV